MKDSYRLIAPYYSWLSKMVFGNDLIEVNKAFSDLAKGKKSLIIGGGEGIPYRDWDETFEGEYWDTSLKMAELAKPNLSKSKVEVNCGSWTGNGEFDVVFLPFVLDCLPDREIERLTYQICNSLRPEGKVILSDFFSPQTFIQKTLLHVMILVFRIFAGHRRTDLPDYDLFLDTGTWKLVDEKSWRKGWIRSRVYEKVKRSKN